MKKFTPFMALLACVSLVHGRQEQRSCGTHAGKTAEELQLHLRSDVARAKTRLAAADKAVKVSPDIGNIAHLDDGDGVIAKRNPFNLNAKTLRFLPSSGTSKYRVEASSDPYDTAAATNGTLVANLDDDDTRELQLPFSFPYFGGTYRSIFINSDGNISFGAGDAVTTDRSLGRFLSGPPRIAALFDDLDPTRARDGIRILSEASRFVVSWSSVPEYRDSAVGPLQTFQIRLYPDGKVELAFSSIAVTDAVTGISPGGLRGEPTLVSFLSGTAGVDYPGAIAERFSGKDSVDIFTAAQKFYRNHEDAYDYLVIYNAMNIPADDSAVAYEVTVRNQRSGYGDIKTDVGDQAGSPKRLQAILNMGPLNQYPRDPTARVPARLSVGDTPLSTIAHETGHLFLAYASVRDENGGTPMLGYQSAHWDFLFNSDASLLEGNRIQDNGAGASPRFLTTATVEGFSALDQYLMGFRPPDTVPDTFYVANARGRITTGLPQVGLTFDGDRRDVNVRQIIAAEGRRTPDHTVSQRKFRFAFMIITANGDAPTADQLAQLEAYRTQFEPYFAKATGQNAVADTAIRKSVQSSSFPAVGVVQGGKAPVTLKVQAAPQSPLTLVLRTQSGAASAPSSVTIPAGATEVSFELSGASPGTDELTVEPSDPSYDSAVSRIQVLPASRLGLTTLSESSPVRVKVTDDNELPYPGVTVQARANSGSVNPQSATTDSDGIVSFNWTPTGTSDSILDLSVPSGPSTSVGSGVRPVFTAGSVVNAASFVPGIVPGGIATVFGTRMGGTNAQVLVNGQSTQIFFANDRQVNFLIPTTVPAGNAAELTVRYGSASTAASVPVTALQPGIFYDTATVYGAVVLNQTGVWTMTAPPAPGDFVEIYATGLGAVQQRSSGFTETVIRPAVTAGGLPAEVVYSGPAPGFPGLYQINAKLPVTIGRGAQDLSVTMNSVTSNTVKILVR